jgi:hypothetical protein
VEHAATTFSEENVRLDDKSYTLKVNVAHSHELRWNIQCHMLEHGKLSDS